MAWGADRIDTDHVWSDDGQNGIGVEGRSVSIRANATITGEGVVAVIMDSGIKFSREDLEANLDVDGDGTVDSGDGDVSCVDGACGGNLDSGGDAIDDHGTHVAGIVAAVDNDIGVIGTLPKAKLLSVNIFDVGAYFSDVVATFEYLVIKDRDGNITGRLGDIVNQSFGWPKNFENQW